MRVGGHGFVAAAAAGRQTGRQRPDHATLSFDRQIILTVYRLPRDTLS